MLRGVFGKKNKRGAEPLISVVIFVVLNVVFITGLLVFIFRSSGGAVVYEQAYAKQIAILIDSSKPVMEIKLNMENTMELIEKNKMDKNDVIKIEENNVMVKLSERGGYSYSFFKDVDVTAHLDVDSENNFVIIINKREK